MAILGCISIGTFYSLSFAQSSVDPKISAIGPKSEVPIAIQNARWKMLDADINTLTFRSMDTLFNHRKVSQSGRPSTFIRNDQPLNLRYNFEGKDYNSEEFLDRTYTNAMLVMKNGKIVYEIYRNNSNAQTRFMGWSTTKSLISLLVGSALEQGLFSSIDDDITDYLPELKTGAYNGVTIRQILQMRSGVDYEERYDFNQPGIAARNHITSLVKNVSRFVDVAKDIKRLHSPGKVFQYKTIDTAVLGLMIERISHSSLAAFTTKNLWEPLGTEADGFFIMDGKPGIGREFSGAGFNAVLRDYARLGQMMINQGQANGKQIIPAAWIRDSIRPAGKEDQTLDYGYQWWTLSGTTAYSAIGLQGQFIFIDPSTKTMVVKLSYFPPLDKDDAAERESLEFFQALSKWNPNP